ncbi:hypothetical protein AN214_02896 [Pseudoalteromonas sp. P1-9]|uniref:DUF2780 domain-containing protein n=1 Tax=Pseudoalteromonas sp. P1-9 TaxID=1710354 RepID=UPI0006D61008|nr:DUF2780 domain-containing protein [Pseudoalteromonas sp. P1-9]KPV95103.1 hypothetical protein AN214_02896 [Pseudoalteromonas sp. P1-9]
MKKLTLVVMVTGAFYANSVSAVDLKSTLNTAVANQTAEKTTSNALVKYASEQLSLSENIIGSGMGALLKVAKDHVSPENFALISQALPNTNGLISEAPKSSMSSLTSMLGKGGDKTKQATSLGYLDSAFESIGIPKEQVPLLVNSLVGYMANNGYSKEANLLKQGLSFL